MNTNLASTLQSPPGDVETPSDLCLPRRSQTALRNVLAVSQKHPIPPSLNTSTTLSRSLPLSYFAPLVNTFCHIDAVLGLFVLSALASCDVKTISHSLHTVTFSIADGHPLLLPSLSISRSSALLLRCFNCASTYQMLTCTHPHELHAGASDILFPLITSCIYNPTVELSCALDRL